MWNPYSMPMRRVLARLREGSATTHELADVAGMTRQDVVIRLCKARDYKGALTSTLEPGPRGCCGRKLVARWELAG